MHTKNLILNLQSDKKELRAKALNAIYTKCFPHVKSYVVYNQGSVNDAEDAFQQAISITYFNLLKNKIRQEESIYNYTIVVAKKIWIGELKKKKCLSFPQIYFLPKQKSQRFRLTPACCVEYSTC